MPAKRAGFVRGIDNRSISRLAKLAGAPADHVAGVDLHAPVGTRVDVGQPLFTVYAGSPGELDYALSYLEEKQDIIDITEGNEE